MSSRISAERTPVESAPALQAPARGASASALDALDRVWYFRVALVAAVLLWTLAWYWESASSMAAIWWRSDTFAHGLVVYPISLWLVWRKRAELMTLPCRPSPTALALMALVGFGWLLGDLGDVNAARHLGFSMMLACSVWAVLGTPIARAISFPLAFSLLAVPVGEFLLPSLMQHTADFTVGALRLSGIPVYREANNFVIPSGSWSVVEACSGLRYLIASVVLGLLYAYLSYRSLLRRVLFVVASIAVPIVANWIRAYAIVMIGHLSGMKYAVGVDHLVYGWFFFGVVMLLLFWMGSHWREDTQMRSRSSGQDRGEPPRLSAGIVVGAVLAAAVIAAAPLYGQSLEAGDSLATLSLEAPRPANGWVAKPEQTPAFRPTYFGARGTFSQRLAKGDWRVDLFVAYYARERPGNELITSSNTIRPTGEGYWTVVSEGRVQRAAMAQAPFETTLRSGTSEYLVWHWYWAADRWIASPELVKALQAFSRLRGQGDDAAIVAVATKLDGDPNKAREVLSAFYEDMLPSLRTALHQSREARRAELAKAQ